MKTYGEIVTEYEFHPESKLADADGNPCGKQTIGLLQRRHMKIDQIKCIGKEFVIGNTITGNGGASVSCDTTSLVVGDVSTFSKIACSQIERTLGPPRPGNVKRPNP